MNEKLTQMLSCITDSRTKKYAEEIERQKVAIEEALFKFLDERKGVYDDITRATILQQNQNTLWFTFELDADVLPEVAEYISKEYNISVDSNYAYKVYAQYSA